MPATLRRRAPLLALLASFALSVHALHLAPPGRTVSRTRSVTFRSVRPVACTTSSTVQAPALDEVVDRAVSSAEAEGTPRRRWFNLPRKPLLLGLLLLVLAPLLPRRRLLSLYHAYESAAIARPLLTKSVTSGVAYLLGDAIAQRRSSPGATDRGRLTRATIAGAVSHGPQLHYWTVLLERSGLPLLGKVALDQTFFALYINAAFCLLTEALQRQPLRKTLSKAR